MHGGQRDVREWSEVPRGVGSVRPHRIFTPRWPTKNAGGWLLFSCSKTIGLLLLAIGGSAWGVPECLGEQPTPPRASDGKPAADAELQSFRDVLIRKIEGESLLADVYRPNDASVYPLVVMIHGGAWSAGDKWELQRHAKQIARAGFVAVTINYRLAPKFKFPTQVEDCRAALKWAADSAAAWQADDTRIGLWGYSAGGHLAALLAARSTPEMPKVSACVAGGAPCEFSFIPETNRVLAPVMGGTRSDVPAVYQAASPIRFVSQDTCPMFLFHGTADFLVPRSSSRLLFERLQELSVPSDYYTATGKGHLLTFLDNTACEKAIEFLQLYLTKDH